MKQERGALVVIYHGCLPVERLISEIVPPVEESLKACV